MSILKLINFSIYLNDTNISLLLLYLLDISKKFYTILVKNKLEFINI